ncbi:NAD(P)H-dependent oxidoreductase [Jatrophihabitans sp.]|uniref:NAD(P)H-dependent oxidoreductase n=1 Tax=Jatrophihabitans sp. TaxID=1932789 RepID=UPI0030C6E7A0|nr:NADPH-dependent reductase [Jatrophihabitans sp.]
MPTLLIVHHTASPAMHASLDAVLAGVRVEGLEAVEARVRPALTASVLDLLEADGILLGTPANIGYMSGALKFFFDNVFYPTLTAKVGTPYGLYVHGNNDTAGAVRGVESIAHALGWSKVAEPVLIVGAPTSGALAEVGDLASTVAAHAAGLLS